MSVFGKITSILFLVILLSGCKKEPDKVSETHPTSEEIKNVPDSFSLLDFLKKEKRLDSICGAVLEKMSDSEKVSQMIISSIGKYGRDRNTIDNLIKSKIIGGVVFLGSSKSEIKNITSYYNSKRDSLKIFPLLFSTDAEPSLINKKILDLSKTFNLTSTIKDESNCMKVAEEICKELKDLHINQNYAPVCDLNVNKEIISNRSFSDKDAIVVSLASTFIKTTQSNNIISTAKHFPGHGYVKGDSHKEMVYINGDLKELNNFKNMIDSGVISIMVGHIIIRDNEKYDTDGLPSTISPKIIDLLRVKLGFNGLIITDAMNMEGVTKFDSPALQAAKAGCDLILMPTDERKLFSSMLKEMKDPKFNKQVNDAVFRIIRVKICMGLFKN